MALFVQNTCAFLAHPGGAFALLPAAVSAPIVPAGAAVLA